MLELETIECAFEDSAWNTADGQLVAVSYYCGNWPVVVFSS